MLELEVSVVGREFDIQLGFERGVRMIVPGGQVEGWKMEMGSRLGV